METEYYDWIGVVDSETEETVAKISINSLVAWNNPVGSHCWTDMLASQVKVRRQSCKFLGVVFSHIYRIKVSPKSTTP